MGAYTSYNFTRSNKNVRLRVGTLQGSIANVHVWVFITGPVTLAAIGMQYLRLLHLSGDHPNMLAGSSLQQAMIDQRHSHGHSFRDRQLFLR
jgi:hypothetical protein